MKCRICETRITPRNTGNMEYVFGARTILTPAEQERYEKIRVPVRVCVDCRKEMLMSQIIDVR